MCRAVRNVFHFQPRGIERHLHHMMMVLASVKALSAPQCPLLQWPATEDPPHKQQPRVNLAWLGECCTGQWLSGRQAERQQELLPHVSYCGRGLSATLPQASSSKSNSTALPVPVQASAMPLPFPAPNLSPAPIPADRLPRPCKAEGAFAPNSALRLARRLFEGQVVGSGRYM